ncbi:MAG: rod shape-determining protein RodA, partial [Bacillota bacterium]|nr:rod shape-determining protein RodA [Bacillota bacterium]
MRRREKGFQSGYKSRAKHIKPTVWRRRWNIFGFLKGLKMIDRDMLKNLDWMTLGLVVFLLLSSLVAIIIATANPYTGEEGLGQIASQFDLTYVLKQSLWIIVGGVALFLMLMMDYIALRSYATIIYWVMVGVLASLFVLATATRGTLSWFKFGEVGFQPSEIAKIAIIIMLSKIITDIKDRYGRLERWRDFGKIMLYFAIPFGLIAAQPDFGTAMVYLVVLIGILFMAKASWKYFATLFAALGTLAPIAWFFILDKDQKGRILSFLDLSFDPSGAGYNVLQSKLAIGSGQLTGKGFQPAMSQLGYIPERYTDFIFAVIAESFGFIGAALIITVFALLIFRLFKLAQQVHDGFGSLIIIGILAMMAFHVFENIAMTMGIMPITGIPLPFVSYGGSSMLTNMLAIGIVLNISMRNRRRTGLGITR